MTGWPLHLVDVVGVNLTFFPMPFSASGMPRRYIDYPDALLAGTILRLSALTSVVGAGLPGADRRGVCLPQSWCEQWGEGLQP